MSNNKLLAIITSVLVVAAIVAAFASVGSPSHQRLVNFDQRKVTDLQQIQTQIVSFYQAKGQVPASLTDLHDSLSYDIAPVDPQINAPYEYHATASLSFQLCANFNFDSKAESQYPVSSPYPVGAGDLYNSNWSHGAGRVCFDRTIDPQRYPRIPTK